jgi:hypothetical protein
MALPFPLPSQVTRWLLGRGFSLSDWEQTPIAADAAADEFGDDAWHAVIDHGRWLAFLLGRVLLAEIRPRLLALDRRLPYRERRFVQLFQQAVCVDLRAVRVPKVKECLALTLERRAEIEKDLSDAGRSALAQLISLLERYLASALVRPRPGKPPAKASARKTAEAEPSA